jgi:signal transduction histidine kinase
LVIHHDEPDHVVMLRRHGVDIGLAAATTLLFALSGTAVSLPLALAQLLPLPWRRRFPGPVLIIVAAATSAHTTLGMARAIGFLPATIAIYTAAMHRDPIIRWVLCPAAGVALAAASAVRHGPVEGLLMAVVLVAVAWLAGVERSEHLATVERLRHQEQQDKLARRVHDSLARTLTVMLVQTEALRATSAQDTERLDAILTAGRSAMTELRAALADHETLTLPDRLNALSNAGLRLKSPIPEYADPLAERLIAEAATNALRHGGPGTSLTITGSRSRGRLHLRILSENTIAPTPAPAGYGLTTLAADIENRGGRLTHGPSGGNAWLVEAIL